MSNDNIDNKKYSFLSGQVVLVISKCDNFLQRLSNLTNIERTFFKISYYFLTNLIIIDRLHNYW